MTISNQEGFKNKALKEISLLQNHQKKVLASQYKKKISIILLSISSGLLLLGIIILIVMISAINDPSILTFVNEETGEIRTESPYALITPIVLLCLSSLIFALIFIAKIRKNIDGIALIVIQKQLIANETPFENFHISKTINLITKVSKTQKIFLDYNNKLIVFKTKQEYLQPIDFKDIINYKVYENGSSIIESNIGKTLLGSAIAGINGAIIASQTQHKISNICNDLSIIIYSTSTHKQISLHYIINSKCDKTSSAYRKMQNNINNICGELESIIALNHQLAHSSHNSTTPNKNTVKEQLNNFSQDLKEELKKIKELYDEHLITKEEYETKKKQILGI